MPKITELYAYVVPDKDEDDEGVPALLGSDKMYYPLMGADFKRAESLLRWAQQVANETGKTLKLVRSTGLEVIKTIEPEEVGNGSSD